MASGCQRTAECVEGAGGWQGVQVDRGDDGEDGHDERADQAGDGAQVRRALRRVGCKSTCSRAMIAGAQAG